MYEIIDGILELIDVQLLVVVDLVIVDGIDGCLIGVIEAYDEVLVSNLLEEVLVKVGAFVANSRQSMDLFGI